MLVLASSSPRRRELLQKWGYCFEIVDAAASEIVPYGSSPAEAVMAIAGRKALAGWENWQKQGGDCADIILGADTMVVLDEVMLGKPSDKEDARRMLSALSGRAHQVMTGIAFVDNTTLAEEKTGFLGWVEVTTVVFRKISQQEIKAYIATGEPMDKAAAYGIQGKAAKFVDYIEGSLTNVIGLPQEMLQQKLKEKGILPN